MPLELTLHPDCTGRAVARIDVEIARPTADALALRYLMNGNIAGIRMPPTAAPVRTDGLWRTTCFEILVAEAGGAYSEFNFAPSKQWAAYHFDAYRAGMQNAAAAPGVQVRADDAQFELRASVLLAPNARRLALAAVIEEIDGTKSYWALRHPQGKPDFHHADSFACELNP